MKERLNWREACEVLGCSRSTFFRMVAAGHIQAHGLCTTRRWYLRSECEKVAAQGRFAPRGTHNLAEQQRMDV